MRKKLLAAGCLLAFILICALILLFCHTFTDPLNDSVSSTQYIGWANGEVVREDGSVEPYDFSQVAIPAEGDTSTYQFYAILPELPSNAVLAFETSGLEITLYIDDREVFHSASLLAGDTVQLSQGSLSLTPDAVGCRLMLTCRYLGGESIIFPPGLRIVSDTQQMAEATAYANLLALPTGAFALALALICGLFLLSLSNGKAD